MSLEKLNLPPANNSIQWTMNETALRTANLVLNMLYTGNVRVEDITEMIANAENEQFVAHEKLYQEGCNRHGWTD